MANFKETTTVKKLFEDVFGEENGANILAGAQACIKNNKKVDKLKECLKELVADLPFAEQDNATTFLYSFIIVG